MSDRLPSVSAAEKAAYIDGMNAGTAAGSAEWQAMKASRDRYRAALARYGQHRPGCYHGEGPIPPGWPCVCGLKDLLDA